MTAPRLALVLAAALASGVLLGLTSAEGAQRPVPSIPQYAIASPQGRLGAFADPVGIATGPDGTVYVTEEAGHRVQLFDPDGTVLAAWGSTGHGDGRLRAPSDVAVAPAGSPREGTVYVAEEENDRVVYFDPAGGYLGAWGWGHDGSGVRDPQSLLSPGGIAVAQDGTVYVSDLRADVVRYFGPDGQNLGEFGWPGTEEGFFGNPAGLAVSADGTVYVADSLNDRVQYFGPNGEYLGAWGETGSGQGQLRTPVDVTVADDGTVYVADQTNVRVEHFSADGQWLGTWGEPGGGDGQLSQPSGVAAAASGGVMVMDAGNHRVQHVSAAGQVLGVWGEEAEAPTRLLNLDFGPDGSMFAFDIENSRVVHMSADGVLLEAWGGPGTLEGQFLFDVDEVPGYYPGVAVAADGSVYVSDKDNHRIQYFDPSGNFLGQWGDRGIGEGQFIWPAGLAIGPSGSVYVSDSAASRIQTFSPSGDFHAAWGEFGAYLPGLLFLPSGLDVAPDGTLYVSDTANNRIQYFDAEGRHVGAWGATWGKCPDDETFNQPRGIALSPDGSVVVVDRNNHRIRSFTADGRPLGTWGEMGDGEGQFLYPEGVAVDHRGRVFVADGGNNRVQVFGTEYADTWRGEWFANRWLAGWPVTVTHPVRLDHDWADGAPAGGLPEDGASARFTRIMPFEAGTHRLTVRALGGVRLWVGPHLLVDRWDGPEVDEQATAKLMAGAHVVRLEFNDVGGAASLVLEMAQIDSVPPTGTPPPVPTLELTATPMTTMAPTPMVTPGRFPVYLPVVRREDGVPVDVERDSSFLGNHRIDVERYDVRMVVPEMGGDIEVEVAVSVKALSGLDFVDLDVEPGALKVHQVLADGVSIGYVLLPGQPNAHGLSGIRLRSVLGRRVPPGAGVQLRIRYTIDAASFEHDKGFIYDEAFYGSKVLVTRSSPYFTRYWMPSNDYVGDRAAVAFELHVPDGTVAAANGELAEGDYETGSGLDGEGLRVFRWVQDTPVPTYLMAIAIGELGVLTDEVCYDLLPEGAERADCASAEHRVPQVYYYPAHIEQDPMRRFEPLLTTAGDALVYFSGLLGPYPFDKLGIVMAPHPHDVEYASLILVESSGMDSAIHETAHHWWGNTVTIEHWGDFWVKEGLATILASFHKGYHSTVSFAVCPCNTRLLNRPPDTDPMDVIGDEWRRTADRSPYCKGTAALVDLHLRMSDAVGLNPGDEKADALLVDTLSQLYEAHEGKTLSTEEIVDYLRANLRQLYQQNGFFGMDDDDVNAMLDAWQDRWLELD